MACFCKITYRGINWGALGGFVAPLNNRGNLSPALLIGRNLILSDATSSKVYKRVPPRITVGRTLQSLVCFAVLVKIFSSIFFTVVALFIAYCSFIL